MTDREDHAGPDGAARLIRDLVASRESLRERPIASVAERLGVAGERFLDRGDALHREAVDRVAAEGKLSLAGARQVVLGMAADWTQDRLGRALRSDFPDPAVLDGFVTTDGGERIRAVGGRLALHICSGNVPGVGATSLIRSLLVKCPVLLKPGRTDKVLPTLFARAIAEVDEPLSRSVAVRYWPRGEGGTLEELALATADRVVVYGGDDAVLEFRRRTPLTTPFVAYPHRLSLGAVGRGELDSPEQARSIARAAAGAIGAYDARGCVSPRVIWVEEGATVSPSAWMEMLADELRAAEDRMPAGRVDDGDAGRLRQLADTVALRHAAGEEVAVRHAPDFSWTVVLGPIGLSPEVGGGRAVLVCTISDLAELPARLTPVPGSLQSVALAADDGRIAALSESLAFAGVSRITSFDRIPWPPAWWRHDGQGPLLPLVRWVTVEPDR